MASDIILSPNMILPVPIVNVDPSPDWANNVNACLSIIDGHNHAPNSGVQIQPDGLNINADLTFNGNNATFLRSVRFLPNAAPLALPTDIGALYESGVDLYYNDGNGNVIRITALGAVSGAAGTITGLPNGSASVAYNATTGTYVFQQATNTAANIDIASLILRYPGSYPVPVGNAIVLEVPSSISSGYSLTLPFPASTALEVMTLTNTGVISSTPSANLGTAIGSLGANSIAAARTRAVGATVGIGGVAVSLSCGNFSTASTTYVAVTNLNVTITTSGRPVFIGLIPDRSGTPSYLLATSGSSVTTVLANYAILNGVTIIAEHTLEFQGTPSQPWATFSPIGSITTIDFPIAGTYTYNIDMKVAGTNSGHLNLAMLIAYEL